MTSLFINSHGYPQSTQSTLIPPQNDPLSKLTDNIPEGNVQDTAIDSTPSPSVPLYALPDKLTKKVKNVRMHFKWPIIYYHTMHC